MEKLFLLIMTVTAAVSYLSTAKCLVLSVYTNESPQYRVVHIESDFEIRLYKISWMSALVHSTSFQNSTKEGFHRLYQYLHGANLNSTHFLMTAPVCTADLNLQLDKWKSHSIAVRKFPGYARDDNVEKEKDGLVSSLGKCLPSLMEGVENLYYNYSIAQYNASKHRTGRINEVWMDVSGFAAEGCPV